MDDSLAHHSSLAGNFASSHLSSVKKTEFLPQLVHTGQPSAFCVEQRALCSAPISSHERCKYVAFLRYCPHKYEPYTRHQSTLGMGIFFFSFSDTGTFKTIPVPKRCLNRYLKKKYKTTIDNDNIKNLFGHIHCNSRSHGALTKKRISLSRS